MLTRFHKRPSQTQNQLTWIASRFLPWLEKSESKANVRRSAPHRFSAAAWWSGDEGSAPSRSPGLPHLSLFKCYVSWMAWRNGSQPKSQKIKRQRRRLLGQTRQSEWTQTRPPEANSSTSEPDSVNRNPTNNSLLMGSSATHTHTHSHSHCAKCSQISRNHTCVKYKTKRGWSGSQTAGLHRSCSEGSF